MAPWMKHSISTPSSLILFISGRESSLAGTILETPRDFKSLAPSGEVTDIWVLACKRSPGHSFESLVRTPRSCTMTPSSPFSQRPFTICTQSSSSSCLVRMLTVM